MHDTDPHIEAKEESQTRQHAKGDPEAEIFLTSVDGHGETSSLGGMTWTLRSSSAIYVICTYLKECANE